MSSRLIRTLEAVLENQRRADTHRRQDRELLEHLLKEVVMPALDDLKQDVGDMQTSVATLKTDFDTLSSKVDSLLSAPVQDDTAEITAVAGQVAGLRTDVEDISSRMSTLSQQIDAKLAPPPPAPETATGDTGSGANPLPG